MYVRLGQRGRREVELPLTFPVEIHYAITSHWPIKHPCSRKNYPLFLTFSAFCWTTASRVPHWTDPQRFRPSAAYPVGNQQHAANIVAVVFLLSNPKGIIISAYCGVEWVDFCCHSPLFHLYEWRQRNSNMHFSCSNLMLSESVIGKRTKGQSVHTDLSYWPFHSPAMSSAAAQARLYTHSFISDQRCSAFPKCP